VNDVERQGEAEDEEDADSPRSRVTNAVALGVQKDRGRRAAGHCPGDEELGCAQFHLTNLPRGEAGRRRLGLSSSAIHGHFGHDGV
jgi:hypothetical protein